ncbi:hypothetical protein ACFCVO_11015 [Agromyces sp. NPDC056379]
MTDTTPAASPADARRTQPSTELVLWWVVFGVLAFAALAMLGLWN